MKLGGVTWWRNNYGSILQAYALQHEINNYSGIEYEIINQYGKRIISADNLIDKLKTFGVCKTFQRIFWKFAIPPLKKRSDKLQKFVDEKLILSKKQCNESNIDQVNELYDGFICGSDQIWNPTLTALNSMYWLTFVDKDKFKIAYAPSIGIEKFKKNEIEVVRSNLSSFNAISCRELDGTELINSILENKQCINVLDPTLLVNKAVWDEMCIERKINEPYVFVYLLRGTKKQRKEVEKFAREKNLRIVTMPFLETEYTVWYDFIFGDIKLWDSSPEDFVNTIRYADYVITDSFHSTIFSCIYHVPFMIFPKEGKSQMNRIKSLLTLLCIESRIIDNYESLKKLSRKSIVWDEIDSIINRERIKSRKYLMKALNYLE